MADRRTFILTTGAAAGGLLLPRDTIAAAAPAPHGPHGAHEPRPQDEDADGAADPATMITRDTIREAEKLAGVTFTTAERDMIVGSIEGQIARIVRAREFALANGDAPAQVHAPGGINAGPGAPEAPAATFRRGRHDPGPLPAGDDDVAFAPVASLSRWIERGDLTSTRLTRLYLDRLERHGPKLECVVTLLRDRAIAQAARADDEIRAGRWRGPLHGIPWGAKDLLDAAGTPTTWGATPYRDRVADTDAAVVARLDAAGAVLVAKLTLGALAYGDIWFGGKTRNPFDIEQGSSGSSAGSAAATAAGLVGFSLGTETLGSIVSPCMRCGATGLRPTFGRVPRTGAMALCWSLDKIGPICRTVEDTALVLQAIHGADAGDPASVDAPLAYDGDASARGVRVGYDPAWFEGRGASDHDRAALAALRDAGAELVEIDLPDWPYQTLMTILSVEAAAAFEELTLSDRDDELVWQSPRAWPNSFREARFLPAVDYVQAERFRRRVAAMMAERFAAVQAIIAPSYAASLLLITNNTGHPSLTVRTGFRDNGRPTGITMMGRLFDEGTLCTVGRAVEKRLDVWSARPEL